MRPSRTLSLIWGSPVELEDLRVFDTVEEDIGKQGQGIPKIPGQNHDSRPSLSEKQSNDKKLGI